MSLLVVGSVAIDSVETPYGAAPEALGGSAVYFSYAASFFHPVRLVGVVGEDFPDEFLEIIQSRDIDLAGLERAKGKTFRWSGRYVGDMNAAETLATELNVFGAFEPKIPDSFRDSEFVFLANGGPDTQRAALEQMHSPKFVVADTMNLWIEQTRDALLDLLREVHGLVLNDGEARQLTHEANLIVAGHRLIDTAGLEFVIIKKGEHGCLLFSKDSIFVLPAFPCENVKDPTGAGDSFAGGLMGHLAATGDPSEANVRMGIAYGTVLASFNVEDFSLRRFQQITRADIDARLETLRDIVRFS